MNQKFCYLLISATVFFMFSCSSATWEDANEAGTYESYLAYMDDNPNGDHFNEARNRADSLYWRSVEHDTTADGFETYLKKFPQGRFRTAAQSKLNRLSSGGIPSRARVTGSGVIIRGDHTTESASVGVVAKEGTEVQVLDQYSSGNSSGAILKQSVSVVVHGTPTTLSGGKALRIMADRGDSVKASFTSTEFGKAEAIISKSDIEAMEGQTWYKISTSDGITGWIYGKFIEAL